MPLKIDILTNDGSPLGVHMDDIYGNSSRIGVGGSELYLLTLCEAWFKNGYEVTLYNNPKRDGSIFQQKQISDFNPQDSRDILIIFRSPSPLAYHAKGKKIWLSCDQHTIGDFRGFAAHMDEIVLISEEHRQHFSRQYGIDNTTVIDIPVRTWDYLEDVKKIPYQCLFCSIPDRGLNILAAAWPIIKSYVPQATLKITSGWSLWDGSPDLEKLAPYRKMFSPNSGVEYMGALKRMDMVRIQQESQVLTYPCTFPELFCISVAESQVAGTFPVTTAIGALRTTNMGTIVEGNPFAPGWIDYYANIVVQTLLDPELESKQKQIKEMAHQRFQLSSIAPKWNALLKI